MLTDAKSAGNKKDNATSLHGEEEMCQVVALVTDHLALLYQSLTKYNKVYSSSKG